MSEQELEKLLADAIATQTSFDVWFESAGAVLIRGKWDMYKNDLGFHDLACQLLKCTPEGLAKMVAAVDDAIKQAADLDAKGPGRIAFMQAVKARPRLLWLASLILKGTP